MILHNAWEHGGCFLIRGVAYVSVSVAVTEQVDRPLLDLDRENGIFRFDREQCEAVGQSLHETYRRASPFPHIMLENFLDIKVLRQVDAEFPAREKGAFDDSYSRLKTGYALEKIRSAYITDLLNALNSAQFLVFLERLTGIKGLISDAHYTGGGLHEMARGGHLSIHADFNIHPRTLLMRRLNLILFLNDDWLPDYGGNLELWDRNMRACRQSVAPLIGRAVIFSTDTTSYHGHPEPLTCPPDRFRRSIALYYYTVPVKPPKAIRHTTLFKPRANSNDAQAPMIDRLMEGFRRMVDQVIRH